MYEIEAGEEVNVCWSIKGANEIQISLLSSVARKGEQRIKPALALINNQMILTATNQVGQTTRSLKLSVRASAASSVLTDAPQKSNGLRWLAALVILCLAGGGIWAPYENNAANQRYKESHR